MSDKHHLLFEANTMHRSYSSSPFCRLSWWRLSGSSHGLLHDATQTFIWQAPPFNISLHKCTIVVNVYILKWRRNPIKTAIEAHSLHICDLNRLCRLIKKASHIDREQDEPLNNDVIVNKYSDPLKREAFFYLYFYAPKREFLAFSNTILPLVQYYQIWLLRYSSFLSL